MTHRFLPPAFVRWALVAANTFTAVVGSLAQAQAAAAPGAALPSGAMFLCEPEGLPAERQHQVVLWAEGRRLVVAAPREHDPLPAWARAPGSSTVRVAMQPAGAARAAADGSRRLQWAGHRLHCVPNHDD